MRDEADNKTVDWVGHKIELVKFYDCVAIFEVGDVSMYCRCDNYDLAEFLNGEYLLKPYAFVNSDGYRVDKPEWFGRKELFELNNIFERDFKKFRG